MIRQRTGSGLEFKLTPNAADQITAGLLWKLKRPGSVGAGPRVPSARRMGTIQAAYPCAATSPRGSSIRESRSCRFRRVDGQQPGKYRWKKMIGPRDRRPPYAGFWYRHSTNGWGIIDFMDFCEAAGFEYVPAFDVNESPQDLADFIEYAKGPADSTWGQKRVADGHPKPYRLSYIELGNEERVDDKYAAKFEALAKAIWAKDRNVILVVGDFAYDHPIKEPTKFTGAASGITNLDGHSKILALAKQHNREVWFDVHLDTNGPGPSPSLKTLPTYIDVLGKVAAGAKHKVVVFEYNAGNHADRGRARGNALATNWILPRTAGCRSSPPPMVCSPTGRTTMAGTRGSCF